MKKLLILSAVTCLAALFGCDDDNAGKKENNGDTLSSAAAQVIDTATVPVLDATMAKNMIKHYKSPQVDGNRAKMFRGGLDVNRLASIIKGANSFNIYAAAYLDSDPDPAKKNMPTYVIQVKKAGASAEAQTLYYSLDSETLCPPPPDCNTVLQSE